MKHVNISIYGRVQKVGFRWWVKNIADQLDLKGFVKNQPDGSVYLEVEGNEEQIATLIDFCKKGPSSAQVDYLNISESDIMNYRFFTISR